MKLSIGHMVAMELVNVYCTCTTERHVPYKMVCTESRRRTEMHVTQNDDNSHQRSQLATFSQRYAECNRWVNLVDYTLYRPA